MAGIMGVLRKETQVDELYTTDALVNQLGNYSRKEKLCINIPWQVIQLVWFRNWTVSSIIGFAALAASAAGHAKNNYVL